MAKLEDYARYSAEFIGTFMLVFTIGCNVITKQTVWGGVSIACVLTVMIYALGKSSGGNFNPAVSVALGVVGKMPWPEVGIYCVVQFVAGICGAFAYAAVFGADYIFNLSPAFGHAWWQACLVETHYTFMLCFVVLNVAASKVHGGNNQFYGIAIGFVVVAGAYGGGSVSMGCFNPAVAMGIDIVSWRMGIKYGPVYVFFEVIGAMFAAVLFKSCRPEEAKDEKWINADGNPVSFPVYGMSAKLLSEFLGTYFLVLTVGLNVLGKSTATPFSAAAALMSMVFALGSCSGATSIQRLPLRSCVAVRAAFQMGSSTCVSSSVQAFVLPPHTQPS
jgi:aquaporin Z